MDYSVLAATFAKGLPLAAIFISHSSADKVLARRVADDLSAHGHDIWMVDVLPGEHISRAIEAGIRKSNFLVVLFSHISVASRWVELEWRTAHWTEVEKGTIAVVPVRLDDCEIPGLLQAKKYVDLSRSYDDGIQELIEAVNDFGRLRRDHDFYCAIPVVWSEDRPLSVNERVMRAAYWDQFETVVRKLPSGERFETQQYNTIMYLKRYGLCASDLKRELQRLGFKCKTDDDEVGRDLIKVIGQFQIMHNLRHHDGIFGPLTYLKMAEVAKQLSDRDTSK